MKKQLTFWVAFSLFFGSIALLFSNLIFLNNPHKVHAANFIMVEMTSPEIGFTFGPSTYERVKDGDSFTFTVTLDPEYSESVPYITIAGNDYSLFVNYGLVLAPQFDEATLTYTYTIKKVTKADFQGGILITVENIESNPNITYNTITFIAPNDTIQGFEEIQPIEVENGEENKTFKVIRLDSHNQNDLTAKIGTTELELLSRNGNEFEFMLPKITDDFVVIIEATINIYNLTIAPYDNIDGYTINSASIQGIEHGTTDQTFTITLRSSHNKTPPKMKILEKYYNAVRIDTTDQYKFTIPFAIIKDTTAYIVTKLNEYTITIEATNPDSAQGFVAISPFMVSHGEDNATFTIKRNASHNATDLVASVNGAELNFTFKASTNEFTFTLPIVNKDFTVLITSKVNRYKINLPSGDGYDIINIVGSQDDIPHNGTLQFTVRVHESHELVGELVTGQSNPNPAESTKEYTYTLTITSSLNITVNVKVKIFILTATTYPSFDYVTGTFIDNQATVEYGKPFEFSIELKTECNRSVPVFETSDNLTWYYTSHNLASGTYTFEITNITQNLEIMLDVSTVKTNTYQVTLPPSGNVLEQPAWTTSTTDSDTITHGGDFTFSIEFNSEFDNSNFTIKVYNFNNQTHTSLLNYFNKTFENIFTITDIKCDILIEISFIEPDEEPTEPDDETYDIIFIQPTVENGSVTFTQTQFEINTTLVITFNPKAGTQFKNITINETPIKELVLISNLQMSFNDNAFTIQVTKEWLNWACQSNIAWIDANGILTLNIAAESEPINSNVVNLVLIGIVIVALLTSTCVFVILRIRKHKKLSYNKQSTKHI